MWLLLRLSFRVWELPPMAPDLHQNHLALTGQGPRQHVAVVEGQQLRAQHAEAVVSGAWAQALSARGLSGEDAG